MGYKIKIIRLQSKFIRQIFYYFMEDVKNVVITGGNTGIGYETAKGLFGLGYNIIFGSRNQSKNINAVKNILASFPNSKGTIRYFGLDLSKRASVEAFVKFVKQQFKQVDILINNAGMIMNQRVLNEMGVEMMMAVNHFGHFYLTHLLFPLINNSKQARIINVSSRANDMTSLVPAQDLAAQRSFGSFSHYSKSKLANIQFTVGLAQRLTKYPKIKAMSLHPGVVDSQFGSEMTGIGCFKVCCCCMYVDNQTGARTSLFLSTEPFSKLRSGQYYDSNTQLGTMNVLGRDRDGIQKLWKAGEKLYGIEFTL